VSNASLGRWNFRFNPDSVKWSYKANTRQWDTKGGRVVQLLSCTIEDLMLTGWIGKAKDADQYKQMERFEDWVISTMDYQNRSGKPIRFVYRPRNWDARVFLKTYPNVTYDVTTACPRFTVTLVVAEGLDSLAYISSHEALNRLKDGIDWQRTQYNSIVSGDAKWKEAYDQLLAEFTAAGKGDCIPEVPKPATATGTTTPSAPATPTPPATGTPPASVEDGSQTVPPVQVSRVNPNIDTKVSVDVGGGFVMTDSGMARALDEEDV
jgi:hypothetical protein